MDNRQTNAGQELPTGIFNIENNSTSGASPAPTREQQAVPASAAKTRVDTPVLQAGGMEQVSDDFAVGNVRRNVTEKTLKKRMARFVTSKEVMVLAILVSVSALLTFFRGYILPVTLLLGLERCAIAATLWVMFFTAGKRGKELFSWLPVIETVVASLLMLFISAFIGAAMFSKQFLVSGQVEWIQRIYDAGMWAVLPALFCLATAYCIYLFKRHERLLCCNIRDSLKYGFSFGKGSYKFFVNCVIVAVAMVALYIIRAIIGDFGSFDFLSDGAAEFYNAAFPKTGWFWFNFIGVLIHAAAIVLAGVLALRYGVLIKRFKHQRESSRRREAADRESVNELRRMEEEKEAERLETRRAENETTRVDDAVGK